MSNMFRYTLCCYKTRVFISSSIILLQSFTEIILHSDLTKLLNVDKYRDPVIFWDQIHIKKKDVPNKLNGFVRYLSLTELLFL